MANIKIEIISVKVLTNPGKKAGSTYQSLDVAYRNLTFQNKVEGRKIMAFGATAETFKVLSNATGGDVFDIEVVKNANGYNDWTTATKTSGDAQAAPASAPAVGMARGNPSPKSTYETPEERAKKQIYIARQSSLKSAIDTLSIGAKTPPKVDDVIGIAKQYEEYVFGAGAVLPEPEKLPDNELDDDIPF